MLTEHLLPDSLWAVHFRYMTSLTIFAATDEEDTIISLLTILLIIFLTLTEEETEAKRTLGNLPTTTQLVNGGVLGFQSRQHDTKAHTLNHCPVAE